MLYFKLIMKFLLFFVNLCSVPIFKKYISIIIDNSKNKFKYKLQYFKIKVVKVKSENLKPKQGLRYIPVSWEQLLFAMRGDRWPEMPIQN